MTIKNFVFHTSWLDLMETAELTDSEIAGLIAAMCKYTTTGEDTVFEDRTVRAVWHPIRACILGDVEQYRRKCETLASNGRLGGRPPKKAAAEEPTNNADTDQSAKPQYTDEFQRLWDSYPCRVTKSGKRVKYGKQAAFTQYKKRLAEHYSYDDMLRAVINYGESQDPMYIKDCERFLGSKLYWLDFLNEEPAPSTAPHTTDPGITASFAEYTPQFERLWQLWPWAADEDKTRVYEVYQDALSGCDLTGNDMLEAVKAYVAAGGEKVTAKRFLEHTCREYVKEGGAV